MTGRLNTTTTGATQPAFSSVRLECDTGSPCGVSPLRLSSVMLPPAGAQRTTDEAKVRSSPVGVKGLSCDIRSDPTKGEQRHTFATAADLASVTNYLY